MKRLCRCGFPAKWAVTWSDRPDYIGLYCDSDLMDGLEEDIANTVERLWLWEKRAQAEITNNS